MSAGTLQASMTEFQNYLCKLNNLQNMLKNGTVLLRALTITNILQPSTFIYSIQLRERTEHPKYKQYMHIIE